MIDTAPDHRLDSVGADLGVDTPTAPLLLRQLLNQAREGLPYRTERCERGLDVALVVEAARQGSFVEPLDGRLVINKQLEESNTPHQLGIGEVMHDLSHRPLAGSFAGVGLSVPKSQYGCLHGGRSLSESLDEILALTHGQPRYPAV